MECSRRLRSIFDEMWRLCDVVDRRLRMIRFGGDLGFSA